MKVTNDINIERALMNLDIAQHLLTQGGKVYCEEAINRLQAAVIDTANGCASGIFGSASKYGEYDAALKSLYETKDLQVFKRYGNLPKWLDSIESLLPMSDVRRSCCTAVIQFATYLKTELQGVSSTIRLGERLNVIESSLRSSLS